MKNKVLKLMLACVLLSALLHVNGMVNKNGNTAASTSKIYLADSILDSSDDPKPKGIPDPGIYNLT